MKQYLVFAGNSYYPYGGWADFQGTEKTLEDALALAANTRMDWWQVVESDSGTFKPVWTSLRGKIE